MRTVKSLSSLSTLAVSTSLPFSLAFAPALASTTTQFQSQPSLARLSAVTTSGDSIPIPPSPSNSTTMTTAAAFVRPPPVLADPSLLLGQTQAPAFVRKSPAIAELEKEEATMMKANTPFWVPPSKSLRNKLNLPAATHLASATTTTRPPRIVGHRGSLYEQLENTRAAFLACEGVCDAVELDVFLLKDGNVVVFHGSGNDRNPGLLREYCTNVDEVQVGATSILDLTLEQARQLRFNPHNPELAAPAANVLQGVIPTLEEVLRDLQSTNLEVKIELKGPGTARPVLELVDRLDMVHQVSFASFNLQEIATVRQLKPQQDANDGSYVYRTGALFDDVPANYLEQAKAVGASEVHLRYDTCTVDRIRDIHASGMGSMVWMRGPVGMKADVTQKFWDIGNEDEACFAALIETGVQQLCVNRPRVLYGLLQKQQQQQQVLQETVTAWPMMMDAASMMEAAAPVQKIQA